MEVTDGVWQFPPVGGQESIFRLDLLVISMTALSIYHAKKAQEGYDLLVLGLLLGIFTETASLRLGGTHCHANSPYLPDFSQCSSSNSVFYYVPWVYCCITSARRLVGSDSSPFLPWVAAVLFFGMCGPYEMQVSSCALIPV